VAEPHQELQEQLPKEPVLNVDETGWRNNGEKRQIVAKTFAFFTVQKTKGAEVLVVLLGIAFGGILCNDRAPAYLKYHSGLMQFCWPTSRERSWELQNPRVVRRRVSFAVTLWRLWRACSACGIASEEICAIDEEVRSIVPSLSARPAGERQDVSRRRLGVYCHQEAT
jgi:hypothetical protein